MKDTILVLTEASRAASCPALLFLLLEFRLNIPTQAARLVMVLVPKDETLPKRLLILKDNQINEMTLAMIEQSSKPAVMGVLKNLQLRFPISLPLLILDSLEDSGVLLALRLRGNNILSRCSTDCICGHQLVPDCGIETIPLVKRACSRVSISPLTTTHASQDGAALACVGFSCGRCTKRQREQDPAYGLVAHIRQAIEQLLSTANPLLDCRSTHINLQHPRLTLQQFYGKSAIHPIGFPFSRFPTATAPSQSLYQPILLRTFLSPPLKRILLRI